MIVLLLLDKQKKIVLLILPFVHHVYRNISKNLKAKKLNVTRYIFA